MTEIRLSVVTVRRAWTLLQGRISRRHAVAGGVAILTAASLGGVLAAMTNNPSEAAIQQHRAFLIAKQAQGDFSEARLRAMLAQMNPGAMKLALRFDPAAKSTPTAPVTSAGLPDPELVHTLYNLTPRQAQIVNSGFAFSSEPNPAAKPFSLRGANAQDRERALGCLTQAVYYEARFEPIEGEQAVAQVVLNRLHHPAFPKTVCGVVYEGSTKSTGCQFSFTCDGSLARPPAEAAWDRAHAVAERALNGFVMTKIGGATHYHTQWVVAYWTPTLSKVSQIGAHIFYRWPGDWGLPPAFRGHYAGGENPGMDVGGDPLTGMTGAPTPQVAAAPRAALVVLASADPAIETIKSAPLAAAPVSDLDMNPPTPGLERVEISMNRRIPKSAAI
jgi:spore germination cell wall hydrolase CwlJ-like protein